MANATFDEKVEDLISKHVPGPRLSIGPDKPYYALLPGRNPNDPLDQAMRGAGQAIMSDIRGNPRPLQNTGFDIERSAEGAIPTGNAPVGPQMYRAFHRLSTMGRPEISPDQPLFFGGGNPSAAINTGRLPSTPGYPILQDVSRQALGFPRFGNMEEGLNRIAALPDRTMPRAAIETLGEAAGTAALPRLLNPQGGAIQERNMGDVVLAANRGPASGYSFNPPPDQMGDYEYGGKFNGKDVYFYKPQNDMQTIFNNAKSAILEYQRRNPNDPMVGAIENLLNAMQVEPNAASRRNMEGAHADLYRGQAGAIPSEIEERTARAKYYGREMPFVLGPGQRAFVPGREPGEGAIKIAEGAEERPGTSGMEKMNEFDKVQFQAAAHLAQNSLDPDQQKLALEKMAEIEAKYNRPKMNRNDAYAKLKATGKYSDDQINAKLTDLGL